MNHEVVKCSQVTWPIRHVDSTTRDNVIRSAKVGLERGMNCSCYYERIGFCKDLGRIRFLFIMVSIVFPLPYFRMIYGLFLNSGACFHW